MARHKSKSTTVKILNPHPGRSSYTSLRRAGELVAEGRAKFSPCGGIFLTEKQWLRSAWLQYKADREEEAEFLHNRGGIVFWNGNRDADAFNLPGCVRS